MDRNQANSGEEEEDRNKDRDTSEEEIFIAVHRHIGNCQELRW